MGGANIAVCGSVEKRSWLTGWIDHFFRILGRDDDRQAIGSRVMRTTDGTRRADPLARPSDQGVVVGVDADEVSVSPSASGVGSAIGSVGRVSGLRSSSGSENS